MIDRIVVNKLIAKLFSLGDTTISIWAFIMLFSFTLDLLVSILAGIVSPPPHFSENVTSGT